MEDYYQWTSHGEPYLFATTVASSSNSANNEDRSREDNRYREMVMDVAGPSFVGNEEMTIEEEPNVQAKRFYDLLKAAEEPLYDGCGNHSQLSVLTRMLSIKSDYNIPRACFDEIVKLMGEIVPSPSNKVPSSFYSAKKLASGLGLPYEKIHCCINGCKLYRGEYRDWDHCHFCEHPRWKPKFLSSRKKKDVPYAIMHYLPVTPRLQRLYASPATAEYMRWHKEHPQVLGELIHPSDAGAWKAFDNSHPSFSAESRNVRLGLCTDGFAPFGHSGKQYSCWPVIVTPYNLPPWMCMRK